MRRLAAALAVWSGLGDISRAASVIGNLDHPVVGTVPVTLSSWQASSIEIADDSVPWQVRHVTLRLQQSLPNRFVRVCLVGESAFRPDLGDVKVEFSTTALVAGGSGEVTLPVIASSSQTLSPGERCWLVVGVASEDVEETPSTGLFLWSYASGFERDEGSFADWSLGALTASAGTAGAGWEVEPTTPYSFSIDAVPVRAPVTLASWREGNPGGATDPESFLNSDPEGDGWTGLHEFAFDRDRSNALTFQRIATGFVVEFVRWVNAPGLSYELQSSDEMSGWASSLTEVTTLIDYDRERVRVYFDGGLSPRRFFRIDLKTP